MVAASASWDFKFIAYGEFKSLISSWRCCSWTFSSKPKCLQLLLIDADQQYIIQHQRAADIAFQPQPAFQLRHIFKAPLSITLQQHPVVGIIL